MKKIALLLAALLLLALPVAALSEADGHCVLWHELLGDEFVTPCAAHAELIARYDSDLGIEKKEARIEALRVTVKVLATENAKMYDQWMEALGPEKASAAAAAREAFESSLNTHALLFPGDEEVSLMWQAEALIREMTRLCAMIGSQESGVRS